MATAWVVALAVISLAGRQAGSAFSYDLNGGTATPSQQAASFLRQHFPGQAGDISQVVFRTQPPVTSPSVRDKITTVLGGIAIGEWGGHRGIARPLAKRAVARYPPMRWW